MSKTHSHIKTESYLDILFEGADRIGHEEIRVYGRPNGDYTIKADTYAFLQSKYSLDGHCIEFNTRQLSDGNRSVRSIRGETSDYSATIPLVLTYPAYLFLNQYGYSYDYDYCTREEPQSNTLYNDYILYALGDGQHELVSVYNGHGWSIPLMFVRIGDSSELPSFWGVLTRNGEDYAVITNEYDPEEKLTIVGIFTDDDDLDPMDEPYVYRKGDTMELYFKEE